MPTLIVGTFGLTSTAITLWRDLQFEDPAVASLLCNAPMYNRCQASQHAIFYGEWIAGDDMKAIAEDFGSHLDWATAVIAAMRAYLVRFAHTQFSTWQRCSDPDPLSHL
jgi:hypothetical protein